MRRSWKLFRRDEDGAVSVDWVALTAAIVIFSALVAVTVRDGAIEAGDNIKTDVISLAN